MYEVGDRLLQLIIRTERLCGSDKSAKGVEERTGAFKSGRNE